jgi:hypothetical protein
VLGRIAGVPFQLVIWNLDLGPDVDMRTLQRPVVPMISYRAVRLSALSDAAVKALRAQNTAQLVVRSRHRKLIFAQCRAPELDHLPEVCIRSVT